jgi:glycerophosphoryl diester phosphodiesterase
VISLERRDGRPLRIGHRGAAALAPENTLASFREAVDVGVDLIEFDVLELRGGELVVAHSYDLHEVSHGALRGNLATMTMEELRAACPDLPTLDDALAFFVDEAPEVGAHVDLKSPAAASGVAAAVRRFGMLERSFVSSFHFRALRGLAALEPGLRLGATFPRDVFRLHGRGRGADAAVGGGLSALRTVTPRLVGLLLARSGATALVLHHGVVSEGAVGRAHARTAPVVAWTVDDRTDLDRVSEAGVDAVVTNNPSIFVSTLET